MNNKLTIFSVGLAICGTITFVSCSQENDFLLDTNLDIDSQVPMARSAGEQIVITGNTEVEKKNKSYTKHPNACGVTTMVDAWINHKGSGYFQNPNLADDGMTAEKYQDRLINEMVNDPSYGWTPESTSMTITTLMKLNDRFPVGTTKDSEGRKVPKKLFSGYKTFSSPIDANNFFDTESNCKSINGVMLEDENGNGHMAFVRSYSRGKLEFTGYSIFDKNGGYSGGSLKANGDFQNGWKIAGVILK